MSESKAGAVAVVIAAIITAISAITIALIEQSGKSSPQPPSEAQRVVTAPSVPSQESSRQANAAPTSIPERTSAPQPEREQAQTQRQQPQPQLEGVYDIRWQNYEPRPSQATMQIVKVSDGYFNWQSDGLFPNGRFISAGRIVNLRGRWTASIDSSNDPSLLTNGLVPVTISFDGQTLSIKGNGGQESSWQKR